MARSPSDRSAQTLSNTARCAQRPAPRPTQGKTPTKRIPSFFSETELPRENSVFFRFVDRTATKHEIQSALLDIAATNGEVLSDARALNLAARFKKGLFDPDLARFIQYSDPTGETATRHADKALGLAA